MTANTTRILGIDIGGSALKGAPVDVRRGALLAARVRIGTPDPSKPRPMLAAMMEIVHAFEWKGPVGVGFPGVIRSGTVLTAANLHSDWIGVDLASRLARAAGSRVAVINDADAAGLAEMRFGAGRGAGGSVLMVTVGTGIGTALFHDGRLQPNTELGHLPLRGRPAEKLVSAAVRKEKDLSWEEWGGRLGAYLRLLEDLLWPDLIIIGGGVSARHGKFFRHLKLRTRVVPAKLRNEAGIVGAALSACGCPPAG